MDTKQHKIKEDAPMLIRRVGQFAISSIMIETNHEAVLHMFQDVIVISATLVNNGTAIQYMGISKHFREVLPNATVPEYDCKYIKGDEEGGISIEWVEKPAKLIQRVG